MSGAGRGPHAAFAAVFGEGLTPDAMMAALADPARTAERLLEVWDENAVLPAHLPPLDAGELRPLLATPGPTTDVDFRWAEQALDRLTAALTYAHRAVIADPFECLEPLLRASALDACSLAAVLHVVAFAEPIMSSSTMWMVRRADMPAASGHRQLWPEMYIADPQRFSLARMVRWIEDRFSVFDNQPTEARWSRMIEDQVRGNNTVSDLARQTNAMSGRAHLLFDSPFYGDDWDTGYDEQRAFESVVKRASRHRGGRRHAGQGELAKLALLLQRPVPDMSIVTPDRPGGLARHRRLRTRSP